MSKANQQQEESLCHVTFLGDRGVGKTKMIEALQSTDSNITEPCILLQSMPTEELLFHKYRPEIEEKNQKYFDCYFIDTPGDLNLNKYFSAVIKSSNIIIIVYDVTRPETFRNVNDWLKIVNENKNQECHIYLIGNKGDLCLTMKDVVMFTDGQELVQKGKFNWFWEFSSVTKIAKPNILEEIAKSCIQLKMPEVPKKELKKRYDENKKNKKAKSREEEKHKKKTKKT